MSIFVARDQNMLYTFGSNLRELETKLNITIDINTCEHQCNEEENCEYYTYEHEEIDIFEFKMNLEKPISLMQCTGPSGECCFLIPKSNIQFFKEMSHYMNESARIVYDEGDRIEVTVQTFPDHKITKYVYCNGDTPSDLMTFALIEIDGR